MLGEYLHPGSLVAAVAHHELSGAFHHCHLAWVPELSLLLARNTKLIAESSVFLKHLYPVVIGVRHNDLFLEAETESMR